MVGDRDEFFMRKALRLAERGRGRTSPNPLVGAVIVDREGVIVGRGAHEFAGGSHAEVHALTDAGPKARGATLYCTLEPCCHHGRTGPCASRVADAGISRVVVATEDPNPRVAGGGNALLRARGVDVFIGVLAEQARQLNAPFFSVMTRQRPFVTMKVALSLDGRIAAGYGSRTYLTGSDSNRHVHRERAEVDAIAIGSGTMLADDPLLNARIAWRYRPLVRVVFDRRLRTPPTARLLSTLDSGPVIIATAAESVDRAPAAAASLRAAGARVESFPAPSIEAVLQLLAAEGVNSLIVEGGAGLHRAFWDAGVVDRVQIFVAPAVLGETAVDWIAVPIVTSSRVVERRARPLGEDILIEALCSQG